MKRERFYFEFDTEPSDPGECAFCGTRYRTGGLVVGLTAARIKGIVGPWRFDPCGECLSNGPGGLASVARQRASVLDGRFESREKNMSLSRGLLDLAKMLDSLENFNSMPFGNVAAALGETYRTFGPWRRSRKRETAA